jgi:hypothetical protein
MGAAAATAGALAALLSVGAVATLIVASVGCSGGGKDECHSGEGCEGEAHGYCQILKSEA